jgi:hypothetical protein
MYRKHNDTPIDSSLSRGANGTIPPSRRLPSPDGSHCARADRRQNFRRRRTSADRGGARPTGAQGPGPVRGSTWTQGRAWGRFHADQRSVRLDRHRPDRGRRPRPGHRGIRHQQGARPVGARTWLPTRRNRVLSPHKQRTFIRNLGGAHEILEIGSCRNVLVNRSAELAAMFAARTRSAGPSRCRPGVPYHSAPIGRTVVLSS